MFIKASGNNFDFFIEQPAQILVISAVVLDAKADRFASRVEEHFNSADYTYHIHQGGKGDYDTLRDTRKQKAGASKIEQLPNTEKLQLLDEIAQFILAVTAYKADWKTS